MTGAAAENTLDRARWLWLAAALGPAASNAADVLEQFEDAAAVEQALAGTDLSLFFTPAQLSALRVTRPEDYIARLDDCARQGVGVAVWGDEDYPALLRTVASPPPVLYYRGDIRIPNERFTFAIVGTRRPSAYGMEATARIARELAGAGVVLVSGLAEGLDSECHRAALKADTPTVACIAFGHDRCYPARNRPLKELIERQGLVVSEYPPGTPPQRPYFLQRNRLIAGLSRGLCVAEARRRSGTMNTVGAALAAGRDVFSVPGSIFSPLSEGTNGLLREGAAPALCGGDILAWYGLPGKDGPHEQAAGEAGVPLSEGARTLYAALGACPQTLAALCGKTGLAPAQAMAALTELELAGLSRQLAGRQFQRRE